MKAHPFSLIIASLLIIFTTSASAVLPYANINSTPLNISPIGNFYVNNLGNANASNANYTFLFNAPNPNFTLSPIFYHQNSTGYFDFAVYRNHSMTVLRGATFSSNFGQTTSHPLVWATYNISFNTTTVGTDTYIATSQFHGFYKGGGANQWTCSGTNASGTTYSSLFTVSAINTWNIYQIRVYPDRVECWFNGNNTMNLSKINPNPSRLAVAIGSATNMNISLAVMDNFLLNQTRVNWFQTPPYSDVNQYSNYSYVGPAEASRTFYRFTAPSMFNFSTTWLSYTGATANFSSDGINWYNATNGTFNNSHFYFLNFSNAPTSLIFYNGMVTVSNTTPLIVSGNGTYNSSYSPFSLNATNFTASYLAYDLWVQTFDETNTSRQLSYTILNTNATTSQTNSSDASLNYLDFNERIPNGADTLTISNSSYLPRNYFVSVGNTSVTNLTAYLVPNDAFTSLVRFHINNQNSIPIQSATVTAQKFIDSAYVTVGQAQTDVSGIGALYLNINTNYRVVISATGYDDYTTSITPTTTDYYITMSNFTSAPINTTFTNITAVLSPERFNHSVQNQNVSWNLTDTSGTLANFNLTLFYANGTTLYSNQVSGSPSGGVIYVIVNSSGKEPFITAQASFTKTNFSTYTITRVYSVRQYASGNYTLNNAFSRVSNATAGFSTITLWVLVLVLSILATGFINRYAPDGYGALIAASVLTLFTGLLTGLGNAVILAGIIGAGWLTLRKLSGSY